MYQVEGIDHPVYPRDEYVCLLIVGLHGLHQINCYYWRQFSDYLITEGFQQSAYDPCMFIGPKDPDHQLAGLQYMPVQVDDLACFRANTAKAKSNWIAFLSRLGRRFTVGDYGPLSWHCQQKVVFKDDGSIQLSHARHVKAFLQKHDSLNCTPRDMPYEKGEMMSTLKKGLHS